MTTANLRKAEMAHPIATLSQRSVARLAGLAWLIIIAAGIYADVFIRSSLITAGDAAATASNIMASEGFFRLSIAGDLVMLLADVGVALALYILLQPINRGLALLAAFFRLVQASILGVNLLNLSEALHFLSGADALKVFETEYLHTLALAALDAHATGYDLGLVFFAFSLFILGYLFFTSSYVPRVLAALIFLSGVVYLSGSLVTLLAPAYSRILEPAYLLPFIAELAVAFWLLIKGVNVQQCNERTSATPTIEAIQRGWRLHQ